MVRSTTANDDRSLSDLPDALADDDAVEQFGFADVPGTTLTVHFVDDADAFDVSRVVSIVDGVGYDLDDLTEVDWLNGSHVVATFAHGGR